MLFRLLILFTQNCISKIIFLVVEILRVPSLNCGYLVMMKVNKNIAISFHNGYVLSTEFL